MHIVLPRVISWFESFVLQATGCFNVADCKSGMLQSFSGMQRQGGEVLRTIWICERGGPELHVQTFLMYGAA